MLMKLTTGNINLQGKIQTLFWCFNNLIKLERFIQSIFPSNSSSSQGQILPEGKLQNQSLLHWTERKKERRFFYFLLSFIIHAEIMWKMFGDKKIHRMQKYLSKNSFFFCFAKQNKHLDDDSETSFALRFKASFVVRSWMTSQTCDCVNNVIDLQKRDNKNNKTRKYILSLIFV